MTGTETPRERIALDLLSEIATGSLDLGRFTPDAHWWWNGGLDLPVQEFAAILARLHEQMKEGIRVVPGLVLVQAESVMVEATTKSPLKDGRVYDNRYIFLIHFADDRVCQVREYSDSAHVLATFDLG